jgi:hypothetical protein
MPADDKIDPSGIAASSEASVEDGLKAWVYTLIGYVRAKLRDYPELNRLVAGQENSDRLIGLALMETVDDYNTTPPPLEHKKLSNFPNVSLLIQGAVVKVLQSLGRASRLRPPATPPS